MRKSPWLRYLHSASAEQLASADILSVASCMACALDSRLRRLKLHDADHVIDFGELDDVLERLEGRPSQGVKGFLFEAKPLDLAHACSGSTRRELSGALSELGFGTGVCSMSR